MFASKSYHLGIVEFKTKLLIEQAWHHTIKICNDSKYEQAIVKNSHLILVYLKLAYMSKTYVKILSLEDLKHNTSQKYCSLMT